jgi:putative transposase
LKFYTPCMKIRMGYKYRLKANRHIKQQFIKTAGACRFVWNKILALNERRYLAGTPRLNYYDAWALVAWWKQSEEHGWLKKANWRKQLLNLNDIQSFSIH